MMFSKRVSTTVPLFLLLTLVVLCNSFVAVSRLSRKASKQAMAAAEETVMDCLDPQV
jgi:hypothetical protein